MTVNFLRIVALLLVIGAVAAGWFGLRLSERPAEPVIVKAPPMTYPQVVVEQTIPAGEVLKETDLSVRMVEQKNLMTFSSKSQLIGKMTIAQIEAGSPVLTSQLPDLGPAAEMLKPGERGIAIKVDEVVGVGGHIKPGDHVDVLLFLEAENKTDKAVKQTNAQVVLQDVRVLSYGPDLQATAQSETTENTEQNSLLGQDDALSAGKPKPSERSNEKSGAASRSAVLAVKEFDMTRLMLAANTGSLRLALRGAEPPTPLEATVDSRQISLAELAAADGKKAVVAAPGPSKLASSPARKPVQKSTQVILHSGDKTETISFKEN